MVVIEVISITRSPLKGPLSYFSMKDLSRGDLVLVPVRGKFIEAIITEVKDAKELKTSLKKSTFKLKSVKDVICEKFFLEKDFSILEKIHKETMAVKELLLFKLIPKALFLQHKKNQFKTRENLTHLKYSIKGSIKDRIIEYRTMIREHFARNQSFLIVSPRMEMLRLFKEELSRGIEHYTYVFSSELPPKKYLEAWTGAENMAHPAFIISTPHGLLFDRADLETIVLDDDASDLWWDLERPWLDLRNVAKIFAEVRKNKLIYTGDVLSVERVWQIENRMIEPLNPYLTRLHSKPETRLIKIAPSSETFSWFTKEGIEELEEAIFQNRSILIFVNRKGYSSFTVCLDCSRTIVCQSCSAPLVVHIKPGEEREFSCHHCLSKISVPAECPFCGSWRLKDYGLGIEKIKEEFRKIFPKVEALVIDADVKLKNGDVFQSAQVVIGTEKIFFYPPREFDIVFAASIDHFFTVPDFRMNEKVFYLINELKKIAGKKMILQSRLENERTIEDALSGNFSHFYQNEIGDRKNFLYPPFRRLIKLSFEAGRQETLLTDTKDAMAILHGYEPVLYEAFIEKIKNRHRMNILLRLEDKKWPDEKLYAILEKLSGKCEVIVDPNSIL